MKACLIVWSARPRDRRPMYADLVLEQYMTIICPQGTPVASGRDACMVYMVSFNCHDWRCWQVYRFGAPTAGTSDLYDAVRGTSPRIYTHDGGVYPTLATLAHTRGCDSTTSKILSSVCGDAMDILTKPVKWFPRLVT